MLDSTTRLVLAAFAVWRLTHLLAQEDGPWDLVVRLRRALGQSWAGKLMDCFYCLSLWVAAPAAALVCRGWQDGIIGWLALSGAACLLNRIGSDRNGGSLHELLWTKENGAVGQSAAEFDGGLERRRDSDSVSSKG